MKILRGPREELEKEAANIIGLKINELVSQKGKIIVGLPGGSSISGILANLRDRDLPWDKVNFFLVDERLVPLSDEDSNYKLIADEMLNRLIANEKLPKENVYPFVSTGDNVEDLKTYNEQFKEVGGKFDIIILSSGEDGHVASLFPKHETIANESNSFFITETSPKPPDERVTASRSMLEAANMALILFFGGGKSEAFRKFNSNADVEECPAKLISNIEDSYVFRDEK